MAVRNYSSTAVETTLSAAATDSETTLAVASATGFPAVPFVLCVDAGAVNQELVLVTGIAGTNLTVTRGYDSTVASAHEVGAVVQHSHAAIDFREANNHVNATSGVHGATGALMGATDVTNALNTRATAVEVLTNKDLTAATNSFPAANPRGVLGYAQVTANQGSITAATDLTGLSVAVTVATSRRIRITASVLVNGSTLEDSALLAIAEGATQLQRAEVTIRGTLVSLERSVIITPTAGAHTYKLTLARNAGTGTVTMQAAATYPAFILVEDIGAA